MYDDMDDESAPPSAEDASVANDSNDTDGPKDKSDETEDQLALVPTHFFKKQPKPGDREMIEVVEVYEGDISVKCVYGDDDKDDKEEEMDGEAAPVSEPDDEMMA